MPLRPPSGPAPAPRSLAARAALSVALLSGVVVLAIAIIAALVTATVTAWIGDGERWPQPGAPVAILIQLIIATVIVTRSLGYAIVGLFRRPSDPPGEVEVPRAAQPTLYAMVDAVAGRIGVRPPDRIVLTWEVNAYVREFGVWFGLTRGKRTLAIGTPLFDVLDVTSLTAVIGHELGHLARGDTRLAPLALRTDVVLARLTSMLRRRWFVGRLFRAYRRVQRRISTSVHRAQETVADRGMVRIAGRQAAIDALRAREVAAVGQQMLLTRFVEPLLLRGRRPDSMSAWLRTLVGDAAVIEALYAAATEPPEQPDPWATHPPLLERIAQVAMFADEQPAPPRDRRAARILLSSPEQWYTAAEHLWWEQVAPGGGAAELRPIAWSKWAEVVVGPLRREQAEDVDTVLGQMGLQAGVSGIHAVLSTGRERELAGGLIAQGWRLSRHPEEGEDRAMIRGALLAVLSVQAVDVGGCRWESRAFGDHALIDRSGTPVNIAGRVDAALAGDRRDIHTTRHRTCDLGPAADVRR